MITKAGGGRDEGCEAAEAVGARLRDEAGGAAEAVGARLPVEGSEGCGGDVEPGGLHGHYDRRGCSWKAHVRGAGRSVV